MKKAKEIEAATLSDGQIVAQAHAPKEQEGTKRPRLFTQDPEERPLLLKASRMVDDCLQKDPSKFKFRCRLSSAKSQYTITIILGNGRDAPEEHILQTRAKDLDQAVALKKALQSHILNREGIESLRYGYLDHSTELKQSETVPVGLKAPEAPELRGDFYVARFVGEELQDKSMKPVQVVFPLGVRVDPVHQDKTERLAQERLNWLARQLLVNDNIGMHETRDELTARMRRAVIERSGRHAWKEHPTLNLHGSEHGEPFDLGFPNAVWGQETKISGISVHYMGWSRDTAGNVSSDAEESRNPTWHLQIRLTIKEGDHEYKYQPVIKLQTSNEQAAHWKSEMILESLQQSFADLAAQPEARHMYWHMEGAALRGQIKLADNSGQTLPVPHPNYLSDIVDDAVELVKSDFFAQCSTSPNHAEDGHHFVISMRRGHGVEQDEQPYKDTKNQPLMSSLRATDAETMTQFTDAVNATFRDSITNKYSARVEKDGVIYRQQPQKFNDHTIENDFYAAIKTQLENPRFEGKVSSMGHAGAIARQERGAQRGA